LDDTRHAEELTVSTTTWCEVDGHPTKGREWPHRANNPAGYVCTRQRDTLAGRQDGARSIEGLQVLQQSFPSRTALTD
jgi:hypothetical protein